MDLEQNFMDPSPSYIRSSTPPHTWLPNTGKVTERVPGPVRSKRHIHSYPLPTQQHTARPTKRQQVDNQCNESARHHNLNHHSWTTKRRAPCAAVLPPFSSLVPCSRHPSYAGPSVPTTQTATSLGPLLLRPLSYPGSPHAYQPCVPPMDIEVVVNVALVHDPQPMVEYSMTAQVSLKPGERRFALNMKSLTTKPTAPHFVLPPISAFDAFSLHSSVPVRHTTASPGPPLQSPFSYPGPPYAYQPLSSTFDGTMTTRGQEETGIVLEVVVNVDLVHGDPGPIVKYEKVFQIPLDPGEWRFALDMKVHMDEIHSPLVSNDVPFEFYSLPASPVDSKQPLPDLYVIPCVEDWVLTSQMLDPIKRLRRPGMSRLCTAVKGWIVLRPLLRWAKGYCPGLIKMLKITYSNFGKDRRKNGGTMGGTVRATKAGGLAKSDACHGVSTAGEAYFDRYPRFSTASLKTATSPLQTFPQLVMKEKWTGAVL
ncbi:hypothetical protein BKA70DRAFT_1233733 [Coprinopsis sp. MPI-PUGE-AT-0042]|nr:hypothetical protein BKA70DRAFT_1233733 [Coprinopsis sp. MPI-PUGE-AT-0042]